MFFEPDESTDVERVLGDYAAAAVRVIISNWLDLTAYLSYAHLVDISTTQQEGCNPLRRDRSETVRGAQLQ